MCMPCRRSRSTRRHVDGDLRVFEGLPDDGRLLLRRHVPDGGGRLGLTPLRAVGRHALDRGVGVGELRPLYNLAILLPNTDKP